MTEMPYFKQVIVVRKDLNMGLGKLISQACHASLESSETVRMESPETWSKWRKCGAKKIIVKVHSERDLLELEADARRLLLPTALIIDRGLTQLPPNTPTALGIGPIEEDIVDKITGVLKLL